MDNIDLKSMEFEFLQEFRMKQYLKLVDLNLAGDEKKDQAKDLKAFIVTLDAECKSREQQIGKNVTKKENIQPTGSAKDFTSHKIKGMSHVIANEVPIFSSGQDVHIWLNKLESYWKLYVANDTTGMMEEHFIQSAKSRLCSEYLNAMLGSSVATDTFEQMKDYMKKNHASKMSVFQILDMLWEMDQKNSESFRDFGIRLDDKAHEAKNIIFAKFKEWAESKNESETVMKADDIFKLVSGQVFLQSLKNKHGVVYNNICNDLDKTWSANEIALKAMTFSDRMASFDDSRNQGTVPDAFTAQSDKKSTSRNDRMEMKNCPFFLRGYCKNGNQCRDLHDRGLKKYLKNKCESENDNENDKKSNDKIPRKESREESKEGQHSTYVATYDEEDWRYNGPIPTVPLPTQNFLH